MWTVFFILILCNESFAYKKLTQTEKTDLLKVSNFKSSEYKIVGIVSFIEGCPKTSLSLQSNRFEK